jgi:hypothetical protein
VPRFLAMWASRSNSAGSINTCTRFVLAMAYFMHMHMCMSRRGSFTSLELSAGLIFSLMGWALAAARLRRRRIYVRVRPLQKRDPSRTGLASGTSAFVHVTSVCTIHVTAVATLGTICQLTMVRARHSTMTAANLAVAIDGSNLNRGPSATSPLRTCSTELCPSKDRPLVRCRTFAPTSKCQVLVRFIEVNQSSLLRVDHDAGLQIGPMRAWKLNTELIRVN